MLRTRFTKNKDVATVAVGCALRTSESSEGKSNSPKNSPICPVKPTPAPVIILLLLTLKNKPFFILFNILIIPTMFNFH